MHATFEELFRRIETILSSLEHQKNNTLALFEEMKDAYLTKEMFYRYQIYAIENNFLRGREAMEERTLRNIVYGYAEFAMLIRRRIKRLFLMSSDDIADRRDELFELIDDLLKTRKELVELAKENVTVLLNAYYNGEQIFNYKFENLSRLHNPHIVPKPLMNHSMFHNSYMLEFTPKLTSNLDYMHKVLQMFLNLSSEVYYNRTLNTTYLDYLFEEYQYSCRAFLFSKSVVYKQGFEHPVKVLTARKADFEKEWDNFESEIIDINQNLDSLIASMTSILKETVPKFISLLSTTNNYTVSNSGSLMHLADIYLANETREMTRAIHDVFVEIQTRGQAVNDAWDLLRKPTELMWTAITDDEDMLDYYYYTANTYFLRNLSVVLTEWDVKLDSMKSYDVRNQVNNKDEKFTQAVDKISAHLEQFQSSIRVGSEFVR